MDALRLKALLAARNRLRKALFSRGLETPPKEISMAREWLSEFVALRDHELYVPAGEGVKSFFGVPIRITPLGAQAVVTFSNGDTLSVQLELQ